MPCCGGSASIALLTAMPILVIPCQHVKGRPCVSVMCAMTALSATSGHVRVKCAMHGHVECNDGGRGGLQLLTPKPPQLSVDEWQAVAEQLAGADDGGSWRGVLRGVDVAAARCLMDPRAISGRRELLKWAAENGCPWMEDRRVSRAASHRYWSGGWTPVSYTCQASLIRG